MIPKGLTGEGFSRNGPSLSSEPEPGSGEGPKRSCMEVKCSLHV